MGLLDYFKRRNSVPIVVNYVNNVERAIMSMTPDDLYETQDALQAVVDFIARSIASTSLKVYTRDEKDDRDRDHDSTTARLLARPNDHMTTYDLMSVTAHEMKLHRKILWLVVQDVNAPSGWTIEPIRRSWILDQKTDGFKVTEYYIQNPVSGTPPKWIKAENFVAFDDYETGISNLTGGYKSPVDPLKAMLREQISAWSFRNQIWDNNGRMTAYISRPVMDSESNWTPEQRDRFIKAWKERYSGNKGSNAGSMPLLEDGMKIESVQFNARESGFEEATKLSRESVAGLYHVNPAQIWSGTGQTYASVKENARSLYVDCLGPDFIFLTQRMNQFLIPLVGDDPTKLYVEFDVYSKLSGNFEEQASVFSTLGGAPCMTVNEIRKRLNLPPSDDPDADKLVKPLNVVYGGQPSPQTPLGDGSDAKSAETSAQVLAKFSAESMLRSNLPGDNIEDRVQAQIEEKRGLKQPESVLLKGTPAISDVLEVADTLRMFYKRQAKPVLANIDRARDKGKLPKAETKDGTAVVEDIDVEKVLLECFDFERWDRELTEDLINQLMALAQQNIQQNLMEMLENPDMYSEEYVRAYVEDMAAKIAHAINEGTFEDLVRAVDDPESFTDKDALKRTPQGVFQFAEDKRASDMGQSVATQIRGWSSIAAVHLSGKQKTTYKTWRNTGANVRSSHAKMNGETIPYANPRWEEDPNSDNYRKSGYGEHNHFSNGCRWPGDFNRNVREVAGCKCEMDVEVRR